MSYHPFHLRQIVKAGRFTGNQGKKAGYNEQAEE
jgi:hypothetical protein